MKHWRIWLGFALSMVLLYLALRGLQLNLVWLALRQANYAWLVPGIVVYFIGLGVRAWRWHYRRTSSHDDGYTSDTILSGADNTQ